MKRCAKCGKPTRKLGRKQCKHCKSSTFVERGYHPGDDLRLGIRKRCAKCGKATKKISRTRCKRCNGTTFRISESIGEAFYHTALFNKEAIKIKTPEIEKRKQSISWEDTDEFGFSFKGGELAIDKSKHIDDTKEQKRIMKWNKMCSGPLLNHRKFRERLEKGVPTPMRGLIWYKLVGEPAYKEAKRHLPPLQRGAGLPSNHYQYFIRCAQLNPNDFTRKGGVIDRDLDRTFPNAVPFCATGGEGQSRLKRVLFAYAGYDQDLGYTQGMNFIVAMLLGFMPEKEAFWVLVGLMEGERFELERMFCASMPLAHTWFYCMEQLLNQRLPEIYAKFKEYGFQPIMYAAEWLFSLFSKTFPKSLVARIWDVFFFDGWPVVFSTALAIIYKRRKAILATTGAAELMMLIHSWTSSVNGDKIRNYSHMHKLKVTAEQLETLRCEYERSNPGRKRSRTDSSSCGYRKHSIDSNASTTPKSAESSTSALPFSTKIVVDEDDSSEYSNDDDSPYV